MEFLRSKPRLVAYAPFDLKNATIYLLDGFGNNGASPTVSGAHSGGATTIAITSGTMPETVPVGASVKFSGDTTKYFVTNRVAAGTAVDEQQSITAVASTSGTWSLSITLPGNVAITTGALAFDITSNDLETAIDTALAGQVVNGVAFTAGDITVSGGPADTSPLTLDFDGASVAGTDIALVSTNDIDLNDSTPGTPSETIKGYPVGATSSIDINPVLASALSGGEAITFGPQELEIKLGEGNFTYDENREIEFLRDRGVLDTYKEGDEQPMDVSFDFTWEYLASVGSIPTIEEALKGEGAASDWVSSNTADPCAPYCVDVEIVNAPDCGTVLDEVVTLPQFLYTTLSHDSDASSVAVTGQCNAKKATILRTNDHRVAENSA